MARYSVKDFCLLIWFMEFNLDQIMKQKVIFQQSKLWQNTESGAEWDLSTKRTVTERR